MLNPRLDRSSCDVAASGHRPAVSEQFDARHPHVAPGEGRRIPAWTRVVLALWLATTGTAGATGITAMRKSVVKIYVTQQLEDYALPWQGGRPRSGNGSGFVVEKKRILTNAHVVSNARFIQLQKDNDPRRYRARVVFIAHDCDLAVITAEDDEFYEGTSPITLAASLPQLNDEVTVLGYPMGGDRLSLTKGVVSRIDYTVYSHSGLDQHLVLQVDAAINPGNSGGPVIFGTNVVGLAFQGLMQGDNIGYAIPVPVIKHFLTDIADGHYDNYPELGVAFLDTRNDALRTDFGLPDDERGVAVYYVDPFGSAVGHLRERDVLLTADGHDIGEDGNISLNGNSVNFSELIERKQWGDAVKFRVWRDKAVAEIDVPLRNPADPFIFRNIYDERPRYLVYGGLIFSPLNREILRIVGSPTDPNVHQLFYYSQYAKRDDLYKGKDEFVVLTRRLPHSVNTYADTFVNGIVETVNGTAISNLADVKRALAAPRDGYQVIEFAGLQESLVLDATAADRAAGEIRNAYGVSTPEYLGDEK